MIQATAQQDWFRVSHDIYNRYRHLPGARIKQGSCQLHRTHMPVIEHLDAARICTPSTIDQAARDRLDQKTMAVGDFKLRQYQHDGVEFIRARRGVLLADEPRVGKTITAIMSHDPALGNLVIVSPLMVRETWLTWLRRAFPGEDIGIMAGKKFVRELVQQPIVFGHYQLLHAWASDQPIGTLIFDEIHELSNPRSKRTIGATMLASRAQRVVGLTGTPIWNKPIGMWSILGLLAPGAFGSYYEFGDRYCDPEVTEYGTRYHGSSNSEELDRRLSQIKIRRLHRDVQADLPPISRDVIVADISDVQRRRIDFAAEALRKSEITNTAGSLARYRAVLGIVKIDVTTAHCKKILAQDEPLVVWTWHKELARKIHQRLVEDGLPAFLISGDIAPAKREQRLIEWKQGVGVLVMTIPTGMVGIDLSHAKYALVVEIDYTPALMEQAEKRTYSPLWPTYVTYVVADHVSDRRMVEALSTKLLNSRPLGLTAAEGATDLLTEIFGAPREAVDLDRMMTALLEYEDAA